MSTIERSDSPNPSVRAIERWKRGFGVAVLIAIGLLPGIVAGVLAFYAGGALSDGSGVLAGLVAFLVVTPWGLGQRRLARQIGKFAEIADN